MVALRPGASVQNKTRGQMQINDRVGLGSLRRFRLRGWTWLFFGNCRSHPIEPERHWSRGGYQSKRPRRAGTDASPFRRALMVNRWSSSIVTGAGSTVGSSEGSKMQVACSTSTIMFCRRSSPAASGSTFCS